MTTVLLATAGVRMEALNLVTVLSGKLHGGLYLQQPRLVNTNAGFKSAS